MPSSDTHHKLEHVVPDVPGAIADMEGGRVRENDGRLRALQGIHGSLVRRVRQIDDHAQPIQFLYHSLTSTEIKGL